MTRIIFDAQESDILNAIPSCLPCHEEKGDVKVEDRVPLKCGGKVVLDTLNLDQRYRYKMQVLYLKNHKMYL